MYTYAIGVFIGLAHNTAHSIVTNNLCFLLVGSWYVTCHQGLDGPFPVWHWPVDSFIVVRVGLIAKSFNRGKKSFLTLFPLTNTNVCGLGYLASHVLLNI